MHKKCPKGVQEAKLRADLWGLLGTLHGGREDRKGVRIRNASEERKNLALGRGQTKLIDQSRVPQGTGNVTRETKSWSDCVDW